MNLLTDVIIYGYTCSCFKTFKRDWCDCGGVGLHVCALQRRCPSKVDLCSVTSLPFIRLKVKSPFGFKDEGQLLPLSAEGSQSTKAGKQKRVAAGQCAIHTLLGISSVFLSACSFFFSFFY